MKVVASQYSQSSRETKVFSSLESVELIEPEGGFLWLDISGYDKLEDLKPLERIFGLHSLALEDCFNVRQRPKIEDFGRYFFIVSRMAQQKEGRFSEGMQLGVFLSRDFVVTVHENGLPQLNRVFGALSMGAPSLAVLSSSYLLYLVLDAVVDDFEGVVRELEEVESNIGCDVLKEKPQQNLLKLIYTSRGNLLLIGRLLRNQSHVVDYLVKKLGGDTSPFLGDVYDHSLRTLERVDGLLEMNMGSLNIYTSSVGHKMNEVMKLLTIISTIGVPLTVLVGWYGMNFREMPEIYWAYGYVTFILIAVGLTAGTVMLFRRKGWL